MLAGRFQHEAGRAAAQEALSLCEQTNDHVGQGRALIHLAGRAWERGDRGQGRTSAEAACQQARIAGDERLLGTALSRLAWVLPKPERIAVRDEAVELLTRPETMRNWLAPTPAPPTSHSTKTRFPRLSNC